MARDQNQGLFTLRFMTSSHLRRFILYRDRAPAGDLVAFGNHPK